MSYSPMDNVYAAPQDQAGRRDAPFELTPEEVKVLQDCSREGVVKRGLPLGVIFGLGGLMGARAGPLMSTRFGAKPAIVGLGMIGYFIGRFSYSNICFERAMQVPNSALRKYYEQRKSGKIGREFSDPSSDYYAVIDPKHDPEAKEQSSTFDIDIQGTSSFDTTPSEYYKEGAEAQKENPSASYTSYDDLRRQNRDDYSKRMYGDTVRRANPQEGLVRRPPPSPPSSDQSGGTKTKYGDVWDA